jgi:hypothetical protein
MSDGDTDPATTLRWNDPLAVEVTAAVQRGQADRVRQLLEDHPGSARVGIVKDGEAAPTSTGSVGGRDAARRRPASPGDRSRALARGARRPSRWRAQVTTSGWCGLT